jgi:hypothetical protein
VTSVETLDKSESVIAALEALRSRVADDDRATLADAQDLKSNSSNTRAAAVGSVSRPRLRRRS